MIRRAFFITMLCLAVHGQLALVAPPTTWAIDIGTKHAQRYTTQLRESETAPIASPDQSFQWATNGGALLLAAPTQTRLVRLHVMQRTEQPPIALSLQIGTHRLALDPRGGIRTLTLLVPPAPTLRVTCTAPAVVDPVLRPLCVALLAAESTPVHPRDDWATYLQHIVLVALVALIAVLSFPQRSAATVAALTLSSLLLVFPFVVGVSWPGLWLLLGGWCAGVGVVHWRTVPGWLRVALIAGIAGVALKGAGVVSPGYTGTDIGFHVHKYEAILRGHIYQIADGQGLTYPYPPTIYLLLGVFAIPLQEIWPLDRIIHLAAVLIDASTVVLLAWAAQRMRWSLHRIGLLCACYVLLPAGFLLQWQATVAQTIGQWLGVVAIIATVSDAGVCRTVAMAAAMVGHFGAFLSLHLTYTMALTVRTVRRHALQWWLVLSGVTLVYFSQYSALMVAQLGSLRNSDATSTLAQRLWQYAWEYGLAGHYRGIFVALCVIGVIQARSHQLRTFGVLTLLTSGILLLAQVLADIDVTRYVIYAFPFVALYSAVPLATLSRQRAGRVVVWGLLAAVGFQSAAAWYAGVSAGVRLGFLW